MSRFLKQMGDNRWELVSVMKIGESFGGEANFSTTGKDPREKDQHPLGTFLFVCAQFPSLGGH
jgi:hypothetical protein